MQGAWQPKSRRLCGRMESVGVWLDMSQTKQPTTPPSSATSSRGSSFTRPPLPFFCVLSCISQDRLSAPWPTHQPIFAAIRRGLGARLRLAISPFALSCGNLGLRSPTAASSYPGGKTQLVPRLQADFRKSVNRTSHRFSNVTHSSVRYNTVHYVPTTGVTHSSQIIPVRL